MKVKDITAIMGNEVNILLEDNELEEIVFDNKVMYLKGKYREAEVEWLRPMQNGIALRVTLKEWGHCL